MKKSLLTLALVGLTASAYAADVYKSETVAVKVGGHVATTGTFSQFQLSEDKEAQKKDEERKAQVNVATRLWLQVDAKATDSFNLGFYLRGDEKPFVWSYSAKKERNADAYADAVKETKTQFKPKFTRAYAYVGHDKFGTLTVGNTSTVADYVFSSSLNALGSKFALFGSSADNFGRVAAQGNSFFTTVAKEVVRYDSLKLGGFGLAYSYANDAQQQALQANYTVANAKFAVTAARQGTGDDAVVFVQGSAKEEGSLVEGLNFGGAYTFAKDNAGQYKSHTGELEVGFSGFKFAQPFLGGSFSRVNFKEQEVTDNGTTTKYNPYVQSWVVYGGLNSELFSYSSVKATAFLEGSYTQVTASKGSQGTPASKVGVFQGFAVAAGAKVAF